MHVRRQTPTLSLCPRGIHSLCASCSASFLSLLPSSLHFTLSHFKFASTNPSESSHHLSLFLCFPSHHFKLPISPFLCSFHPPQVLRNTKTVRTMLCSAPAAKSGSNWLDRLRSIKGIPTGDGLDLDSFLSNHCSSNSDTSLFPPKRDLNRGRGPDYSTPDPDPPSSMRSVLAELFNMGSSLSQSYKLAGKKYPRKQTNPKFFVASSSVSNGRIIIDRARKDEKNVPCTNSSSNNLELERNEENVAGWDLEEDEGKEKESGGNELLKGFSKSEVTVIDTSFAEWKVDKLVFRKNNVWKVRERKGKSKVIGKKKRKGSFGFDNKELRLLDSQFQSPLETDTEEFRWRPAKVRMNKVFLYLFESLSYADLVL